MSDKELADARAMLLAAGIIAESVKGVYHFADDLTMASINHFSLWDLAGALMEKTMWNTGLVDLMRSVRFGFHQEMKATTDLPLNDSLPRAIIEACIEALSHE